MRTFTNCGTPDYISPEVLKGVGASFEADIWSFGVLIAEILGGQSPFHDENPQKTYDNVIACRFRYSAGVYALARELLSQIFVPDP